jgi:UDP-N-acetylmuramate--alanine ligase
MKCSCEEVREKDLENGVHLSGIGGVGMSALAEMLLDLGVEVSGSDVTLSKNIDRLKKRGVKIYSTHEGDVVGNKLVCRTRAVKDDNQEVLAAKKAIFRSDLLAFLAQGKKQLVVAGAHGKTTTSALLAHCMVECGLNPSFAVGGLSSNLDRYGRISDGEFFVLEGDESDGSHLKTDPFGAILTSCDVDHLAFWKEGKRLQQSYKEFASKVVSSDHFFYYGEDPYLKTCTIKGNSYGLEGQYDFAANNICLKENSSAFTIFGNKVFLPMFGEYNIKNCVAVFALLNSLKVPSEAIIHAIKTFSGVDRRMQYLGKNIYSDYAHHPEEVKAVLESLKKGKMEVAIVFEPHRISRFEDEMEHFCNVFNHIVITDVFEASEDTGKDPIPLINTFCKKTGSTYIPLEKIKSYLKIEKRNILALTAGALDKTLREFVEEEK